jgi:DNA-binding MarR family transcriptional regulator
MTEGPAKPLPVDPIAEAARHWRDHGWAEAAEGMAAVTSIMRAQAIVLARVEDVLRPLALTFARYELLMLLTFSSRGAMPMSKASVRLQVHPTSITNAAARLESAGLVVRRQHPSDRRTVLVEITDAGRTLAVEATKRLNDRVFSSPGLSAESTRTLVDVLRELRIEAGDFGS